MIFYCSILKVFESNKKYQLIKTDGMDVKFNLNNLLGSSETNSLFSVKTGSTCANIHMYNETFNACQK